MDSVRAEQARRRQAQGCAQDCRRERERRSGHRAEQNAGDDRAHVPGKQREAEQAGGQHEHDRPGRAGAGYPPLRVARADPGEADGQEPDGDREPEEGQAYHGAAAIAITVHALA